MPKKNLNARNITSLSIPNEGQIDYRDQVVTGLTLRIFSSGRRSWMIFYRYLGRWRRVTLGSYPKLTLADARKIARKRFRELADGIDPARAKTKRGGDFQALAEDFLEANEKRLRPKTYEEWKRIVEKELVPFFGKVAPEAIKRSDIKDYLNKKAQKRGYMANRILEVIRRIFSWAVEEEKVQASPCVGIRKPHEEEPRDRVLKSEEIRSLYHALEEERPLITAFYELSFLTGARRGEVLSMEWTDIDFDQALWTLVAKGGREHVIPLSSSAIRVIELLRPLSGHKDVVFLGPTGRAIANPQKSVLRLRKRSKVDFRIHDIRRTVATGLAQIGVRTDVVSTVLGHVISGAEATRIYERHHRIPEMRTALERWAAHLERIIASAKDAEVVSFPS